MTANSSPRAGDACADQVFSCVGRVADICDPLVAILRADDTNGVQSLADCALGHGTGATHFYPRTAKVSAIDGSETTVEDRIAEFLFRHRCGTLPRFVP